MKALVVMGVPPLPEGQAQGRTGVGLLRGLAANGVDVRAIAARLPSAPPGDPPSDLGVELIDVDPPPRGWRSRIDMVVDPLGLLGHGTFMERVREASADADVVHLEEVSTAPLAHTVLRPSLVHLHYLVRRDRSWPRPWDRAIVSYAEAVRAERRAARATPYLQASSPVVAADLQRIAPSADLTLAPLALDETRYRAASLQGPPVAGMIGTAWWPPTREAIDRLVERVWPRVRRAAPGSRLLLAGRGVDDLSLPAAADVTVAGEVEESAAFLAGLSVLLYPVTRGSGMKVKVLEALACGIPVVTTPQGAEGIGPHDGVVVAEDDATLAAAAAEILRDADVRAQRGAAARELFLSRFSPRAATAPLLATYDRMRR